MENGFLIVFQFGDAFTDVIESLVTFLLFEFREVREPAEGEFLDGRNVHVAVVEPA